MEMAALEGTVISGGKGGCEFSFKTDPSVTIKKLSVTYSVATLNSIEVIFASGQLIKVGNVAGPKIKEIVFEGNSKVIFAKLWPNKAGNKCGGVEFWFINSNGAVTSSAVKCEQLGEPVTMDTKSGKIYGITGKSGSDIDALGFYFS